MKSGSATGTSHPSGALSFNYSQRGDIPVQFFAGVAVTQSVYQTVGGDFPYVHPLEQTTNAILDTYEKGWMDQITLDYDALNFPSTVQGLGNIYIYNKRTGEPSQEHLNMIEDTYFPLQKLDFIRVGSRSSIDTTSQHFEVEEYTDGSNMRRFNIGPDSTTLSPIEALKPIARPYNITPFLPENPSFPFYTRASIMTPLSNVDGWTWDKGADDQNFRIIRRIPTEFYILVKEKPKGFSGEGLLLPENFDKRYNARQVAIDLNVIRTT